MHIVFVCPSGAYQDVDASAPHLGNPGIGGTDYLFAALAAECVQRLGFAVTMVVKAQTLRFAPGVATVEADINDGASVLQALAGLRYEVLVMRGGIDRRATDLIPRLPVSARVVVWAHNFVGRRLLKYLARQPPVRAVVSVGQEQHALQQHLWPTSKAVAIPNFIYPTAGQVRDAAPQSGPPRAVYMGALSADKGFHYLARQWPAIRAAVPDACLDVIGSGHLYGSDQHLGPMGIADRAYEAQIQRALQAPAEELGVAFHGRVSDAAVRTRLLAAARLGLPNPTGTTETFCLSAIEMIEAGCWVLAPPRWGYCDTVQPGVNGTFFRDEAEFIAQAIHHLQRPPADATARAKARAAVEERFDVARIMPHWQALLRAVADDQSPPMVGDNVPLRGQYPLPWRYALPRLAGLTPRFSEWIDRRYRRSLRK